MRERGAGRRRRREEGLMVTVTVGGQLQPETYDRHTQSRTHARTHTNTDAKPRKSQCPLPHAEGPMERQRLRP